MKLLSRILLRVCFGLGAFGSLVCSRETKFFKSEQYHPLTQLLLITEIKRLAKMQMC